MKNVMEKYCYKFIAILPTSLSEFIHKRFHYIFHGLKIIYENPGFYVLNDGSVINKFSFQYYCQLNKLDWLEEMEILKKEYDSFVDRLK